MADEKAIKQMTAVKGAGSYHPCLCCKNIVGRLDARGFDPQGYLQHYSCSDASKFDEYTFEGFCESCAHIKAAWAESVVCGEEAEKHLGISFEQGLSIPFSERASVYRVPETIFLGRHACVVGKWGHRQV